jgi:hypothetical protein
VVLPARPTIQRPGLTGTGRADGPPTARPKGEDLSAVWHRAETESSSPSCTAQDDRPPFVAAVLGVRSASRRLINGAHRGPSADVPATFQRNSRETLARQ